MNSYWTVLGLSLLPALGNFGGGMLAEFTRTTGQWVSKALHAAAGLVMAIVATELMPQALAKASPWWMAAAFAAGGVAYVLIGMLIERLQSGTGEGEEGHGAGTGMWMIYLAVSMDLVSDGLMIGTGSTVSSSLALVLAVGQVFADVPEGYATIANMKDKDVPRARRVLLSAGFAVPVVGTALVSYFLLSGLDLAWQMAALAFIAGILSLAAVEDMISEAHETAEDTRMSLLMFTGGFVLFVLVSAGLGHP